MVEPQIVVLDVAGSSPVDHPIFPSSSENSKTAAGRRRHTLKPGRESSDTLEEVTEERITHCVFHRLATLGAVC